MTAEQTLFDLDVPVDVQAPVTGWARHTDPETSHQAANDATCAIRWGSHRFRLLDVWDRFGAMTDEEAGHRTRIGRVADTRRASELRSAGLIKPTGNTKKTSTGCEAMVCVITDAGRASLAAARKARVPK